jgi:hypothetical protein
VCGVFLWALIFVGNLCCNRWKVLYKVDVDSCTSYLISNVKMLNALIYVQLACEVCCT